MSQTHTLTTSFSGSGVSYSKASAPAGNSVLVFDQSVPIGTDTNYLFAIDRSQLQAMSMTASTDCTICTNDDSGGSPTDTIVLKAGEVYNWTLTRDTLTAGPGLVTCPISADVTAGFFITNAAISVVKIVCLLAN